MKLRLLVMLVLALVLVTGVSAAISTYPELFRGCVIANSDGPGQLDDIECDHVPDVYDNCPIAPNPDQIDRDQNGVGDMCDLVIDEIRIEPEQPMQGRSVIITAYLMNNREYPMHNMLVKAEVPHLGIATGNEVPTIQSGERVGVELVIRIPDCAPTKFVDFVVIAEYPFAPGQKEVFNQPVKVPIVSSGLCALENPIDRTVVDILEIQDVLFNQPAVYPFTIKNMESESKAYILTLEGLSPWGVAELYPGSVLVVPAGQVAEGAIRVHAHPGIEPGQHSFVLTVSARDDISQVTLIADVKESDSGMIVAPGAQMLFGILAFIVVLVLIVLLLFFLRNSSKKHIKKRTKSKGK